MSFSGRPIVHFHVKFSKFVLLFLFSLCFENFQKLDGGGLRKRMRSDRLGMGIVGRGKWGEKTSSTHRDKRTILFA